MQDVTGKEAIEIAELSAGVWELKEIIKKIGKRRCQHVLLSCT
jgi:hypothetical protein